MVIRDAEPISSHRAATKLGQVFIYLFSGAVNSIQITAPSSTSLSAP